MVKIEAVIQTFKLDEVKDALDRLGITGVMFWEVLEHGSSCAPKSYYRGVAYQAAVEKVKLEMLVSSEMADDVVGALWRAARTDIAGDDGTIMVFEVAEAIRIHSGFRAEHALR